MKKLSPSLSLIIISILTVTSVFLGLLNHFRIQELEQSERRFQEGLRSWLSDTRKADRVIIEKFPIYSDYVNPEIIKSFRTYLLPYHLEETVKSGMQRITDDGMIPDLAAKGLLVKLDQTAETPYFFYNVPEKYRYLTPKAAGALKAVTDRISQKLSEKEGAPGVKIAISSALRPGNYQQNLKGRNANAASESSHSFGISFDIFFDEYYTVFPVYRGETSEEGRKTADELRKRIGFLSGAALARQYQSVLSESLLELQEEGLVYVIIEHNQRVYHVSVRH